MKKGRRDFLKLGAAAALLKQFDGDGTYAKDKISDRLAGISGAWTAPVLKRQLFERPVRIAAMELLERDRHFMVRARAADGAEGLAAAQSSVMRDAYPILVNRVIPSFIGKDARDLEALLDTVYQENSNYKWQGLPFWVCVASAEIAILDLLGKVADQPLGALFGTMIRKDIAVYRASGNRGNAPEAEIEYFRKVLAETGANAVKFRLGARMRYDDASTKRDLALIPLMRRTFGEGLTIYADANGSYDVPMALRIGRVMSEHKLAFFEEPVPFDYYDETLEITTKAEIPVAGGEQESSMRRFRWMIENRCVDIVQPDLFYFGGMCRSIRVARMAEAAGMECTPHMSGGDLGYLYVAQFASCVPNAGAHQEFKGQSETLPVSSRTSSLACENGMLKVPTGPGIGVTIDDSFVAKARTVTS